MLLGLPVTRACFLLLITSLPTFADSPDQTHPLLIYHRLLDPFSSTPTSFTPRGAIEIPLSFLSQAKNTSNTISATSGSAEVLNILGSDEATLEIPISPDKNGKVDIGRLLYQVRVEVPEEEEEGRWPMSSSKACHILSSPSSIYTIHLSPSSSSSSPRPFSISHSATTSSKSRAKDACPQAILDYATLEDFGRVDWVGREEWVVLRGVEGEVGPSISSNPSPHRDPNGKPLPPGTPSPTPGSTASPQPTAAPKSFIRKYWMYIATAVLLMFVLGSPEPPSQQGGGKGAGQKK